MNHLRQTTPPDYFVPGANIEGQIDRLDSPLQAEREQAARAIERVLPVSLDTLSGAYRRERRRRRRRSGVAVSFWAAAFLVFCIGMAMPGPDLRFFLGTNIFYYIVLVLCLRATLPSRKERGLIHLLARSEDVLAVPDLLDALQRPEKQDTRTARDALIRLLPRLRQSHRALLRPDQRRRLRTMLSLWREWGQGASSSWQTPEYVVALLAGLEGMREADALPEVERLARRAQDPRVKAAAQACAATLKATTRAGHPQSAAAAAVPAPSRPEPRHWWTNAE